MVLGVTGSSGAIEEFGLVGGAVPIQGPPTVQPIARHPLGTCRPVGGCQRALIAVAIGGFAKWKVKSDIVFYGGMINVHSGLLGVGYHQRRRSRNPGPNCRLLC